MNLFFCETPFHYLMSISIVDKFDIDDAVILIKKGMLKKSSRDVKVIELGGGGALLFFILLNRNKISSFYSGNLKKIKSRFICQVLRGKKIFSFDDGAGSRWGSGYFYNTNESLLKKIVLFFIGGRYQDFWERKVICHYSIFEKGITFLGKKTIIIPLVKSSNINSNVRLGVLDSKSNVFILGSPFVSDGLVADSDYLNKIIHIANNFPECNIFYYCHPREDYDWVVNLTAKLNVKVIASNGPVEMVFTGFKESTFIGFYSTSLVNLKKMNFDAVYLCHLNFKGFDKSVEDFMIINGVIKIEFEN
ncbi:glycosyltransferase family 52 [Gallaecimonas sp. GXIMD1310]|uniref:glycosyltransferase family 52 n=1 Tax=Gallaecimonas sp. GXIMD1310 TaxID=3131926 RepID=UPI00324DECA3